jgi:hypothetical protein
MWNWNLPALVIVPLFRLREYEAGADRRGHGAVVAADGAPDDLVEQQIVGGVFAGEFRF